MATVEEFLNALDEESYPLDKARLAKLVEEMVDPEMDQERKLSNHLRDRQSPSTFRSKADAVEFLDPYLTMEPPEWPE